jgi:hypothetical protein
LRFLPLCVNGRITLDEINPLFICTFHAGG